MFRRICERSFGFALVVGVLGCSEGEIRDPRPMGSSGNAGTAGGGTQGGSGGLDVPLPTGTDPATLLPARIRRLTNAEYDASVGVLAPPATPRDKTPAAGFAPDTRQSGFTVNDAQRVDPVVAKQLAQAAEAIAADVRLRVNEFAPCADMAAAEGCAIEFIEAFGAKAYRRPLDAAEREGLLRVYRAGIEEAAYADGIELVVSALLQSAGFLYLTELGGGSAGGVVALTPYELASSISYLFTAGPPDAALLGKALAGELATPEGREAAVWDILTLSPVARDRVVRVVTEWLGIDRIDETAKDSLVYPEYADLQPAMQAESLGFITAVLAESTRSVGELLSADWTKLRDADAGLAGLYDVAGTGRVGLAGRRGILNRAAFLSVYAHAHESAPVLRGVAVARRVACLDVPSPTTQNIVVVAPPPDETKTTRERFAAHSTDARCISCHQRIDPFGFSFEQFDGMGNTRPEGKDNGKLVDSQVTIALGADFDGSYADSNALAVALGQSASVRECFARHAFRASAGRSDAAVSASEAKFLAFWSSLPAEKQGDILETLVAFVRSPLFAHRRSE